MTKLAREVRVVECVGCDRRILAEDLVSCEAYGIEESFCPACRGAEVVESEHEGRVYVRDAQNARAWRDEEGAAA